jgi:FkbM family methyltransferase
LWAHGRPVGLNEKVVMDIIRSAKASLRRFIDSFYCRKVPSKQNIGSADNWFILTDRINNAIVYSGGVGKDISFEMALANEYAAKIFLFDPSPTGKETIKSLDLPSNVRFYPLGLAGSDGASSFAPPVRPKEGSYRLGNENGIEFGCRSLSSLLRENGHTRIELLKIDIEGFEYEIIDDIVANKLDIRQITVEFHDFYPDISKGKTRRAIGLLKKNGYRLFHKRGQDYSFVKTQY